MQALDAVEAVGSRDASVIEMCVMKTVERGRVGKRSAQVVMSLWADNDQVTGVVLGMDDRAVCGRIELLL